MIAVNQHRDDIQGLRALAVLAVIIFHVNHEWLPGGFIGVDIFFVISGYLITSIIFQQKEQGRFSFVSFYASRLRRIVPAYLFLLATVAAIMAILLIPRDFNSFYDSLKSAAFFNSNNYFKTQNDYFAPASHELPLLHTWSLAVEMQFYLLLPALLVLIPTRLIKPTIGAIAATLLLYSSLLLADGGRQDVYFSLAARIPEFLIGSLLALKNNHTLKKPNTNAWVGLALIALSFIFTTEESAFPGLLALPPCIGTALLISAQGSKVNQWLSGKVFVFTGALSYSLYLWHWPILAGLRYYFEVYELPGEALVIFFTLTLTASLISYYLIENTLRRANGRSGIYKFAAFSGVTLLAVLMARAANPMVSYSLPIELTRYAAPEDICHGQIVGECLRGDRQSSTEILLLGDSHAAQLNYFADVFGQTQRLRIRVITASSCVPIEGFDVVRVREQARESCSNQIETVKAHYESSQALLVAGKWQRHATSDPFMLALDRFLSEANNRNQPVILLAQVPMLETNVQRMNRHNALGSKRVAKLEATWGEANRKIEKLASRYPNVRFVDFSNIPLFSTPPFSNGRQIYQDEHHLNEEGSKAYGQAVSSRLGVILRGLTLKLSSTTPHYNPVISSRPLLR
ncbi:acyltransferase family protein [Pseudomonas saudiphocaensis]|uniref:Acetyltransferase n=1 Tax=Pseudomonas saudiphocaensis TaxID=1499686 RepID=A0A078LQK3_9PSED|nr:acyltransferase family protein [Pseudomonas saudiphocaensis]CDZ93575.1 acetyltransferase [Pseudomonas saudiphocaensis]